MPYPKKAPTKRESNKQEEKNLLEERPVQREAAIPMKKGPIYMNSYDKDMMHERELIYDAKKQAKTGDATTKENDKKLIYDAKGQIHNEDVAKHKHSWRERMTKNSR